MSATTKTLYDTDFAEWSAETAELLRQRRFDEVDWENVIEEVEDLGGAQKRGVRSQLGRLLMHVVKARIQPQRRSASWRASIVDAQREIRVELEDSPSLRHHLQHNLGKIYRGAVEDASRETGLESRAKELSLPETCPYTLEQLLGGDLDLLLPQSR